MELLHLKNMVFLKGSILTAKRIAKCNSLFKGVMTLCHKLYLYLEMIISQIKWSPTEYFEIFGFQIYIYSLMFILAFLLGYNLVKSFFIKEK